MAGGLRRSAMDKTPTCEDDDVLRTAIQLLHDRGESQTKQLAALQKIAEADPLVLASVEDKYGKKRSGKFSDDQFSHFKHGRNVRDGLVFRRALSKLFREQYADELKEARRLHAVRLMRDPLAIALHRLMSQDAPFPAGVAEKLGGQYIGFRPSFLDHGRVMVFRLDIGQATEVSRFLLEMRWATEDRRTHTDTVEGSFLPYRGESILFIGRLLGSVGFPAPFIFIVDLHPGQGAMGTGTLLIGNGPNRMPFSQPLYLQRWTGGQISPATVSYDELATQYDRDLVKRVRGALAPTPSSSPRKI